MYSLLFESLNTVLVIDFEKIKDFKSLYLNTIINLNKKIIYIEILTLPLQASSSDAGPGHGV